jgi:quinol-cytochrome oxidoreductase complex cytochrome b subunit
VTWFDLGALAIVALAAVDGARCGLAWSVTELVLVLAAAAVTGLLRPFAEPYLQKVVVVPQTDAPWFTHLIVFACTAALFIGVAVLLQPLTKRWRFAHDGWPGAAVGTVTGTVAALVLFSLAVWNSPRPYESQLAPSHTAVVLVRAYESGLAPLFPSHLSHRIEDLRTP